MFCDQRAKLYGGKRKRSSDIMAGSSSSSYVPPPPSSETIYLCRELEVDIKTVTPSMVARAFEVGTCLVGFLTVTIPILASTCSHISL